MRLILFYVSVFLLSTFVNAQEQDRATYSEPVRVAVDDLPLFFSPYAPSPLDLQYAHLFFDPLLRWSAKGDLEKRLVDKWEEREPGVVRFYLKKKIKFHSGNELHSSDVIWSFSQFKMQAAARKFFDGITAIEEVDKYRFDVYSSLSESQLLDYLTNIFVLDSFFYIHNSINATQPQGLIDSTAKSLTISGTGPYKIKSYNPVLHLHVVANNDYWQGKAAIEQFDFIKINSDKSRTFALLANDIDISKSISNSMIKTVNAVNSKSVIEVPSTNILFVTINDKSTDILKQTRVREAFNLALNKEGILKHLSNNMGSVSAVFTPFENVMPRKPIYDIDKAKKLLSQVKIPLELTLLMLTDDIDNKDQITTALVNMMKRLGVKLVVTEVSDRDVWERDLFAYDFSLSLWHSHFIDSNNLYHDLFFESNLSSYFHTSFQEEYVSESLENMIMVFDQMQYSYQIIPLLFQKRIWAADNRFNLSEIISTNGIPYWHLLSASYFHSK